MKKSIAAALCLVLALSFVGCGKQEEEVKYDLIPMVMVDGELYLDTGYAGTYRSDDDTYDREITSTVDRSERPSENNQSNFGAGFKYRYGATEGTVEILMGNRCCIYATEEVRQKMQFPERDAGAKEEVQPAGTPAEEAFDIAVSYANWTEESEIYTRALNTDKMAQSSVLHLPIYRFGTLEELEQFKLTFGEVLTMDSGYDDAPSFNDVTADYDEAFFDENTLMLVYVSASSGSYRFGVNSVFCNGNAFCIHVEQRNDPEVGTADMAGWFITVAVPDSMVANCSAFDADLIRISNETL